jgi:hypothetical protein
MATTLLDNELWGTDRATPPKEDTTLPPSGPQADRRSTSAERNPLRAHNRDRLAAATAGARLRLGYDLLASSVRVEAIPPVRGKRGRPRRRPQTLIADRGYDSQPHRQALRARGIRPIIAKPA